MKQFVSLILLFLFVISTRALYAAEEVVALKNNLVYDAAATPNLQLEVKLARRWTLELGAGFNPFPLDDKKFPKWRHLSVSVAPRYWFCNAFHRDFISFNAAYVHYNVAGNAYPIAWMYPQIMDSRYQGDAVMGGVSYGWHFGISPHFSIELEGGVDAGYSWYDQFECKHCGEKKNHGGRWLVLPKLAVNIVVPLGGNQETFAKRCDCELIDEDKQEEPIQEETAQQENAIQEETAQQENAIQEETVQQENATPETSQIPASAEPAQTRGKKKLPAEKDASFTVAERIRASRKMFDVPMVIVPEVPHMEIKPDPMYDLKNRIQRSEESYQPFDAKKPASADPRNVFLYFDLYKTQLDSSYLDNRRLIDSVMVIIGDIMADSTQRITHIQIVGYASFDGPQPLNKRLAGLRAAAIKDYIQRVYPIEDSVFVVNNGGESWVEMRYGLEKEEFTGKEKVIQIIDTEPDLDRREQLIRVYRKGETYRYMQRRLKYILRKLGSITIYCEDR